MMQTLAVAPRTSAAHATHDGHVRAPIDIPADAQPTPETLRSFRMQAGLTKGEAAHIVGLNGKAASWHQYELGRYAIPQERWDVFVAVLRSGRYPSTCFATTRRGPRVSESFEVGRRATPPAERPAVDAPGCAFLRSVRSALRISAAAMAAELGCELHRVYRMESGTTSPSWEEQVRCGELAQAKLAKLRSARQAGVESLPLAELREDLLRLSSTDAAKLAGLKGSRPGATWSAVESGERVSDKAVARFRKAAAGQLDAMERELLSLF